MNKQRRRIVAIVTGVIAVLLISFFSFIGKASAASTTDPANVSTSETQATTDQSGDTSSTASTNNQTDVNANQTETTDDSATTSPDPNETEIENSELSTKAAEDGMVLLQNKNQTLPISTDKSVALFGAGAYGTVKGGTGSGDVNPRNVVNIWDGLKDAGYDVTSGDYLNKTAADYDQKKAAFDAKSSLLNTFIYKDKQVSQADFDASPADVGIYVLSRNAGEGTDRTDTKGDYEITDAEFNNIKNLAADYDQSILLLNVGGQIDTKFIDQIPDLDSVLLVSQGGQNVGIAVADIISGKVTPSGKLAQTWAKNYSDYPASATFADNDGNSDQENYTEGIYVGYRYFDSYNVTPKYEFGYGLSYTTFDTKTDSVAVNGNNLVTKVTVTNTGDKYSGRQVVQEYYSAPKGTVDKAFQNLAAYGKTDVLAPGESQTLTLSFPLYNMASYYTATNSYILDPGQYIVRVGNSSRDTHVAAVLNLKDKVTTEQLSSEMAPKEDPTELRGSTDTFVPDNQAEELVNAPIIQLNASSLENVLGNNASTFDSNDVTTVVNSNSSVNIPKTDLNKTIKSVSGVYGSTLKDVYDGKISMDQFIVTLTPKQLSYIVNGSLEPSNGSSSPIVGNSSQDVPGAAGQTTGTLTKRGINVSVNADGPDGLRLTPVSTVNGEKKYQYATAWPIGTLLAQTFDPEMINQVGTAVGKEMKEFGVDTWLAPGMNIQRDPLNGRNFEYYSEDPLVTGVSATAMTKGVQSNPGVGTTVKHFFANNQETKRGTMDDEIGEQAMREIYLKGFETVVKDAQPQYIMSSYNQVNGQYNAANYDLLTNILRGEWGFKGTVMTDWYNQKSLSDPQILMHAGNDLIMPGSTQNKLQKAISEDNLALGDLQKSAERVLTTIMNANTFAKDNGEKAHTLTPKKVATIMTVDGQNW
ncbi:glycoside hydrolase family 3 protein [Companilactobacillus zhongbaensis]|uniref:glycoside hydrolase family 3 protein n=1 Tax=Companilactobacillus zhongbaensis TaxID=2486009 RepID=UPI000F78055C|nr:glycoside hydrolase family 3 protein [Companilactobacillus zhongbaensis]